MFELHMEPSKEGKREDVAIILKVKQMKELMRNVQPEINNRRDDEEVKVIKLPGVVIRNP